MLMTTAESPLRGAAVTVATEKEIFEFDEAPATAPPTIVVDAPTRATTQQTKIRFTPRYY
jgi:hypothetical protein